MQLSQHQFTTAVDTASSIDRTLRNVDKTAKD